MSTYKNPNKLAFALVMWPNPSPQNHSTYHQGVGPSTKYKQCKNITWHMMQISMINRYTTCIKYGTVIMQSKASYSVLVSSNDPENITFCQSVENLVHRDTAISNKCWSVYQTYSDSDSETVEFGSLHTPQPNTFKLRF